VQAVRTQQRRFPRSRFGAEALWIEADAQRRLGHAAAVEAAIERLRRRHPDSPQARAAASLER
jgi:Tfp pilus assembly protein PilF